MFGRDYFIILTRAYHFVTEQGKHGMALNNRTVHRCYLKKIRYICCMVWTNIERAHPKAWDFENNHREMTNWFFRLFTRPIFTRIYMRPLFFREMEAGREEIPLTQIPLSLSLTNEIPGEVKYAFPTDLFKDSKSGKQLILWCSGSCATNFEIRERVGRVAA